MKFCTNGMSVTVDAAVLLRIAKHGKQNAPGTASGSLLGIDQGNELRVSSCFGYKNAKLDSAALIGGTFPLQELQQQATVDNDFTEYQYEVLRTTAEVRGDANTCGWYDCASHGGFLTEALIENQYAFQKEVPKAVCLIYDPSQLRNGKCGFAAYRLSDKAFKKRQEAEEMQEEDAFERFPSDDLLEQVPVKVHCSPLVETLLLQYHGNNFECLDTDAISPALERSVQLLLESLDEFSLQQREMQLYERQSRNQKKDQAKNMRVPKSVDTINLSKQIQEHCSTIDSYASDIFGKLYLVSESQEVKEAMSWDSSSKVKA